MSKRPQMQFQENLFTGKTLMESIVNSLPQCNQIHCCSSTQCLLTFERKIMNFEPSSCGVARNSESVPFGSLLEPIPEYPKVGRSLDAHQHSAYRHLDKNQKF